MQDPLGKRLLISVLVLCLALLIPASTAAGRKSNGGKKRKGVYHTVLHGETLYSISRTYKVLSRKILKASGLKQPSDVRPGITLFIPKAKQRMRAPDLEFIRDVARQDPGFPIVWPLKGSLTSGFGFRRRGFHMGIDIATNKGIIVAAAAAGTIVNASQTRGYGLTILMVHGNGYSTRYAHLSRIFVRKGQHVKRGQALGAVGNTGNATGSHLHFEIRRENIPLDPLLLLPDRSARVATKHLK